MISDIRTVEMALDKDFCIRLANIHYREWGPRLGIEVCQLYSPFMGNPGEVMLRRWASYNGISDEDAPLEMARRLGLKPSLRQRLLLSEKANHMRLGAVPSPRECDIPPSPLEPFGFRVTAFFPYTTPDGKSVSGGTAYLSDNTGNNVRLPLTPWMDEYATNRSWDWLSWNEPLPLYNQHVFFMKHLEQMPVLVFPTEEEVAWVNQNARWIASRYPITTWPGGLSETLNVSDWGMLAARAVRIVVSPSAEGVKRANTLSNLLAKTHENVGFILPKTQRGLAHKKLERISMIHDISTAVVTDQTAPRDTFLAFAYHEFGLELGQKKEEALPLAEFLSLPAPELTWLIPELLRVGDRVMVYGVAKSGKTTWIVQETLHMAAAGYSVLYVDGEMGIGDFQARLEVALTGTQIPAGFHVLSSRALGRSLQLETPEEQMFVLREAKDVEVVVLDNLHALFPASLQAGPESCEKLNQMVDKLHLSGKTVILIHHSSRGGASFGSSVKELGLELQIKITRKGNDITITPEAARGLSPEQLVPHHFVIPSRLCLAEGTSVKALPSAPAVEEEDEKDQAIRRELEADPSVSCRAIAEKLGMSKSAVAERVKKIKDSK